MASLAFDIDPIRREMHKLFDNMVIGEEYYKSTMATYRQQLHEEQKPAKNKEFQAELVKVQAIYRRVVPQAMAALQKLYDFSQRFAPDISTELEKHPLDFQAIPKLLQTMGEEFVPIQQLQATLAPVLKRLEDRITQLETQDNPPVIEMSEWDKLNALLV